MPQITVTVRVHVSRTSGESTTVERSVRPGQFTSDLAADITNGINKATRQVLAGVAEIEETS